MCIHNPWLYLVQSDIDILRLELRIQEVQFLNQLKISVSHLSMNN